MNKLNRFLLLLITLLSVSFTQLKAQQPVSINVNVVPPYGNLLSEYYNRTIVTLTSNSFVAGATNVKLKGRITGMNNISLYTTEFVYNNTPLVITSTPKTLSPLDISRIFDINNLTISGITKSQLMSKGLPEGEYSLCVYAFDYATGRMLTIDDPNVCSATFTVPPFSQTTEVDPPVINTPNDDVPVLPTLPQNVIFSWTPPTTTNANIQYTLRLVDVIPANRNPQDAMNTAVYPYFFEQTLFSNVFVYGPAQPLLKEGHKYAFTVTAKDPFNKIVFKNNGTSEVGYFTYQGPTPSTDENITLNFIKPNSDNKTIRSNNESDFLINWNWFDAGYAQDTLHINENAYQQKGVKKYVLNIVNSAKKSCSKSKSISYSQIINESNNKLKSYITLSQKSVDSIGLIDSCWYKATVKAYNASSQEVATANSLDFQYIRLKDEIPSVHVPVNAVMKYIFKDKIEAMHTITNTPCKVYALKKANKLNSFLPKTTINGKEYVNLAYAVGNTDENGALHTNLAIPLNLLSHDSIFFKVEMPDKYYIDKNFPLIGIRAVAKDTSINFGQLIALTYGYSLKLYVKKAYTSYLIKEKNGKMDISLKDSIFNSAKSGYQYIASSEGMAYAIESKKLAEGITMVLYRKNKKSYVPPIEGTINDYKHTLGFTEVARGITQKENDSTTFVMFNKLLASVFSGDEYYVIALNNNNDPTTVSTSKDLTKGKTIQKATVPAKPVLGLSSLPTFDLIYKEDGFVAQEMALKVELPKSITSDDSLYRNITATYEIVSTKPPTSLVKGRLMYHWKSDKADQLRPIANQNFRIVTDYLINGRPIGEISSWSHSGGSHSFSELFFVPEGLNDYDEGMSLLDHNKTMAIGHTDAQGNFTVDVVNLNKKGSLGKGHMVSKGHSWTDPSDTQKPGGNILTGNVIDPVVNPDPGADNFGFTGMLGLQNTSTGNASVQNNINASAVNFNAMTNSFDVGAKGAGLKGGMKGGVQTKGMVPPMNPLSNGEELVSFERVYRIVPENKYLYPSKETFAVQSFEATSITNPLVSYVKEVPVIVHTKTGTSNLNQMLITVFRSLEDKTEKYLPIGEGDGKYKVAELISPQYKTTGEVYDKTKATKLNTGSNIFTKKYELLWPAAQNDNNGDASFTTLLAGYEDYYVEACSDPLGQKTYKATFSSINTELEDAIKTEYYLGEAFPPAISVEMTLSPLPSRALIRVLDNASKNSISGAKGGRVTINNADESFVDKDGYVEFLANTYPLSIYTKLTGAQVIFDAKAYGYKKSTTSIYQIAGLNDTKFTFDAAGDQFFYNFLLDPSERMQGRIVNADGIWKTGVPSYIKVDSGKVIETDASGYFSNLPVPGVKGTKISIIPKDVAFFDSTYMVTNADLAKSTIDLKDFSVYRRKHRIKFTIIDKSGNPPAPIASATIQLGDTIIKTNSQGLAFLTFENVSVNNFTFIVRGPDGKNFIPKTVNVKNTESRNYSNVYIGLESGSEVHGKVTLNGKPVKNAKVYLDATKQMVVSNFLITSTSALSNDANLVCAYSDASGSYSLKGIPVNNQKVYIHATLDTTFTVSGDVQLADIKNKTATANLSLTAFKAMLVNNIFGFPLTVEKITVTKSDSSEVKVTGIVHWSQAISDFSLEESNQIIRIEDVTFKSNVLNGKKVGVAQNSSVTINGTSNLKFRYLNKYNVKLTSVKAAANKIAVPEPLVISKENDLGVIRGKVNIVDNSFNYPSTYLNFSGAKDNFFLAESSGRGLINTNIGAVTSAMTETETNNKHYTNNNIYAADIVAKAGKYNAQPKKLFNLSNEKGDPIAFKLIEFNATADPFKSFIDDKGKIHLNVQLSCKIPNAQPENFKLTIEDMVLDDNKVYPANSVSPIKIALEDWTLNIRNWSFSTEQGGIVSTDGLINTKAIDIPFTKFVLRHDLFLMDEFKMKELKMAGGAIQLKNVNDKNAGLVFDNKTGTDMKPHWRFCISGSPAAELPDLTGLSGKIKLNYIQILSNNESVFQLQQQDAPMTIKNNPLTKYSPESIYNGPDYISISGALNVGAPRMGNVQLAVVYKTPQTMKLQNVETDFEGQGFVHFVAREPGNNLPNITIDDKQVKILGNVVEKPIKTFNEIPSTFYAVVGGSSFYTGGTPIYKIEMDKNFVTQLSSEGNGASTKGHSLKIDQGGMSVSGTDWSILTYEGDMSSNAPEKNTSPAKMKFAVMGDISANSSSLSVSNIDTPFGEMSMVFDFANKRLIGKLKANNVALGTNKVTGTIETLFDPDGFYIAGGCKADVKLPNPYIDGVYNLGFMIGSYKITDGLWSLVNSYKNPAVINDCYRTNTAKGVLKGFYFTLDRNIIEADIEFDFILAAGYIRANALIGADVYANFVPGKFAVGMGGFAYANVAAGLSCITGTSISGGLNAKALVEFKFEDNTFKANTSMDLGFNASISQSLVLTTISKDISINCHAAGGTQGFNFSLGSGAPIQKCN